MENNRFKKKQRKKKKKYQNGNDLKSFDYFILIRNTKSRNFSTIDDLNNSQHSSSSSTTDCIE